MSEESYSEIFYNFEEISNSFKRSNQYFDILYDKFSAITVRKTPFSEDISENLKKSGIIARTYTGTWNEIAFDNSSDLKNITKNLLW
jgi:hypothetical protein